MRLRLQTDFALRVLLFLTRVKRRSTVDEVANVFGISRDHLVKVVQLLSQHGYVQTRQGRGGGMTLTGEPAEITVQEVVEKLEGRNGVLECVQVPSVCPMEPGCRLRRLLMEAEAAFFDTLGGQTLADLSSGDGGLHNLDLRGSAREH